MIEGVPHIHVPQLAKFFILYQIPAGHWILKHKALIQVLLMQLRCPFSCSIAKDEFEYQRAQRQYSTSLTFFTELADFIDIKKYN